jgi:hypothetical protein
MNIGTKGVIHDSRSYPMGNVNAAECSFPTRRQEDRVNGQKVCAYSLCESVDGERLTIEQGEVCSLNQSDHGILVLMGRRPQNGQLLELHVAETRWEYSHNVYEVRWIQALPVEAHGDLFLVGCRLIFEGSRYWTL